MRGDEGEIMFQSCPSENRNFDQLPHLIGLRIPLPELWGLKRDIYFSVWGLGDLALPGSLLWQPDFEIFMYGTYVDHYHNPSIPHISLMYYCPATQPDAPI